MIQNEERVVPSFKTTLTSNNERFNKIQDELLVGISLHQSNAYHEWVSLRILFFTGECLTLTADITFVVCVLGWIESLRNHMRLHAHSSWILSRMKPSLNCCTFREHTLKCVLLEQYNHPLAERNNHLVGQPFNYRYWPNGLNYMVNAPISNRTSHSF